MNQACADLKVGKEEGQFMTSAKNDINKVQMVELW
jgi:hypothetical protein